MLSKIFALFGSCSNRTNWLSTVSRLSLVSVKNSRNKSSMKPTLVRTGRATSTRLSESGQLLCKAFKFGFVIGKERSQQRDKSIPQHLTRGVNQRLTITARNAASGGRRHDRIAFRRQHGLESAGLSQQPRIIRLHRMGIDARAFRGAQEVGDILRHPRVQ